MHTVYITLPKRKSFDTMAKPKLQQIKTSLLELNTGQVEGLPQNPRFIRDERYKKLKQSIEDAPEMLDMRSLIVVEHGKKYVTICGNMRLRACLELGYKELPCYVLPADTPAVKLREYTIKDNIGYGENEWTVLNEEWDEAELKDWGMLPEWDIPNYGTGAGSGGGAPFDPSTLPSELQGQDIDPDELAQLQGDDDVLKERVIIVFPKGESERVARLLGLEKIEKVVYSIEELTQE